MNIEKIKREICDIGRRIYDRRMVASNDGNISVKIADDEYLCTPTGVSKGFMTPEYICRIDGDGNVLDANEGFRPSSEIKMHLRVYKHRPDVRSVVHAHPIYATSFAIAGVPLEAQIMPEAVISLGSVPIAKYGTPSTEEIPDAVEPYLDYYDAVLLENHGALSWGDSLLTAYHKMESLEFYAELLYHSSNIGTPREFTKSEIARLYEIRRKFSMTGRHAADLCPKLKDETAKCEDCAVPGCAIREG